ncbi:hypothetical protein L6164_034317 [Bauhinia variegata]|uniref:Uncharacterized protein n=1 Tax=Bauhinia variegata TaxID=167791 RepID=A0ACB9KVA5_BAUVA|nr:hypothetical protein L6164_034317 [Bauhinia variegata]
MQIETGDISPMISTPMVSSMLHSILLMATGEFRRAGGRGSIRISEGSRRANLDLQKVSDKVKGWWSEEMKQTQMQWLCDAVFGNPDLARQVLIRIEAGQLLRLRFVCKLWLSIISDPDFCYSHTRRHHNTDSLPCALLLDNDNKPFPYNIQILSLALTHPIPTPNPNPPFHLIVPRFQQLNVDRVSILQSCNGLMLCSYPTFRLPIHPDTIFQVPPNFFAFRYFVCNPCTQQFLHINLPIHVMECSVSKICLAFDPLMSPYFKLVCLERGGCGLNCYRIHIFSSETRSWTDPPGIQFTAPEVFGLRATVFCRNALHWYSGESTSLYFDLDTHTLKTMPMPVLPLGETDGPLDHPDFKYFGESLGYLHMVVSKKPIVAEFDIWKMEGDYSGWFVKYHVDLTSAFPKQIRNSGRNIASVSVLGVLEKIQEAEVETILVLFVHGQAAIFNLKDQTSITLPHLLPAGGDASCKQTPRAFYLFESLCCCV